MKKTTQFLFPFLAFASLCAQAQTAPTAAPAPAAAAGPTFSAAGAVVGAGNKGFYGDANSTRAFVTFSKAL